MNHNCTPPPGAAAGEDWTCPCGLTWLRLGPVWVDARVEIVTPTSKRTASRFGPSGRIEADDQWLPDHSSATLSALIRHLPGLARLMPAGTTVDSILSGSGLGTGRFVPPPSGAEASVVRYAEGQYAYARIWVSQRGLCANCGFDAIQTHRMQLVRETGALVEVGSLAVCANCEPDSFLLTSHMPSVVRSRRMRARYVL